MSPPNTEGLGSTYRLQLHGLGFEGARKQVKYLHELGIETLYVSPILAAAPGSTHGYDVVDPTILDPQLGTPEEFESLLNELGAHEMRLLIDTVPNHMATDPHNRWWWDVQKLGRSSNWADVFDIDWNQHGGRVLIPTLPAPLAELLRDDQVKVSEQSGEAVILFGEQAFPLDPGSLTVDPNPGNLLPRQHYRPAFWRLGRDEGNYRRFFDIDGLVGVKVELPDVRTRTHAFLLSLLQDERVAGLRIDHIDGLADPAGYLRWLGESLANVRSSSVVVLVEKILNGEETLPSTWDVDGTTGYEFATVAGGLFVDPLGAEQLHTIVGQITGDSSTFEELGHVGKREVLSMSFGAPLRRLRELVTDLFAEVTPGVDLSPSDVDRALTEMAVRLPVYRTYLGGSQKMPRDQGIVRDCVAAAAETLDSQGRRAAQLFGDLLNGAITDDSRTTEIAQRWEQLTGAVMAKGVEDTATYRYPGLLSHAEVGSDPDTAARSMDEFWAFSAQRGRQFPSGLNGTSTHDSKRGEDARAQLYALSEAADDWGGLLHTWRHRHIKSSSCVPSPFDELFVYQTLAAIWPIGQITLPTDDWERVAEYVVKAARESKRHTTWIDPDTAYEDLLRTFVAELGQPQALEFRTELRDFVRSVAPSSATNGLALLVLKSVCPGIPDFYQGTELWTRTLTDPDNRRPIDFDAHRATLDGLAGYKPSMDGWEDGQVKLWVTRSLMHLRREQPLLFSRGSYERLQVVGPLQDHVIGISRQHEGEWLIAMVPRLMRSHLALDQFPIGDAVWAETRFNLPEGLPREMTDVLTGQTLALKGTDCEVADLLHQLPVTVLYGTSAH